MIGLLSILALLAVGARLRLAEGGRLDWRFWLALGAPPVLARLRVWLGPWRWLLLAALVANEVRGLLAVWDIARLAGWA